MRNPILLPDIKLVDSVRGEDPETADSDEDHASPETLAQGGEVEVDIITETDHQLTGHRQETHQDLTEG